MTITGSQGYFVIVLVVVVVLARPGAATKSRTRTMTIGRSPGILLVLVPLTSPPKDGLIHAKNHSQSYADTPTRRHADPFPPITLSTARTASPTVTAFIHRKSRGQSRRKHGLHST